MILGVSEWLSGKIGLTTQQVRIGFLLAVLLLGAGIGLYIILWLVKILMF